jgi:hypothetical protein
MEHPVLVTHIRFRQRCATMGTGLAHSSSLADYLTKSSLILESFQFAGEKKFSVVLSPCISHN